MPQVYSASFDVAPRAGLDPAGAFHCALLEWIGARWPTNEPWFQIDESGSLRAPDGSIFRWEPFLEPDRFLLDLTWRHPHVGDPTIHWSTQAAFYSVRGRVRLSLRVSNTGPEYPAPQALLTTRPRLLLSVLELFNLRQDGCQIFPAPTFIGADGISDFVRYTLFDTQRAHPVILLSPKSDGSYVQAPGDFATEWVGLGEPVVLDSPAATFRLTDELDSKELSCFHGGLRAYLPRLGADPTPFRHPLLVARRVMVADERRRLANFLAYLTTFRYKDDPELHKLRDERSVRLSDRHRAVLTALTEAKRLATGARDWEQIAVDLDRTNKSLEAHVDDLREQLEAADAKIAGLQYALSQKAQGVVVPLEEPAFLPSNAREAVEVAQATLGDRLCILPSAIAAASESPFADPAAIYQALRHLADLSARMAAGPLGMSLKAALQEVGLDYASGLAPTTPKKLLKQFKFTHQGAEYSCEEHLRIGSSSYDPKECARIYFTTKQLHGSQIVVGHVGRHLDVMSTS